MAAVALRRLDDLHLIEAMCDNRMWHFANAKQDGRGSGRFVGRRIDLDSTPMADQWLLTAHASGPVKQLDRRELQAARLCASGLTYRAIAAQLGVAPATVRNQLRAGFAKLGVSSKVELARRLGEIDTR